MPRILLEVCIESVDDALTAAAAGADRLELNSALCLGGLTPSPGVLLEIRRRLGPDLPIVAMIRPRPGGFCYSAAEVAVMERDVDFALAQGASGIAFGILTPEGRVDMPRCRRIINRVVAAGAAAPEGAVFHRAFDFVPDAAAALEQLIELGVRRVLTSGQRPSAPEGAELLARLIQLARGRIKILPGGGVRPENVAQLLARTACRQVHGSFREPAAAPDRSLEQRPEISFDGPPSAAPSATSGRMVAEMVRLLH